MRKVLLVALLLCVRNPMHGADAWRTGQLVNIASERVLAGTVDNPYTPFPSTQARYATERSYVIRAGDREFTISEQPSRYAIRSHVPRVVVNTPIRFRIEKGKATFLDDDGKEFKGQVEREVLLKPTDQ